jgi:hypothetical protein
LSLVYSPDEQKVTNVHPLPELLCYAEAMTTHPLLITHYSSLLLCELCGESFVNFRQPAPVLLLRQRQFVEAAASPCIPAVFPTNRLQFAGFPPDRIRNSARLPDLPAGQSGSNSANSAD